MTELLLCRIHKMELASWKLRISRLSGATTESRILAFGYFGTTSGVVIWEGDERRFPFQTLQSRQLSLFVLLKRNVCH